MLIVAKQLNVVGLSSERFQQNEVKIYPPTPPVIPRKKPRIQYPQHPVGLLDRPLCARLFNQNEIRSDAVAASVGLPAPGRPPCTSSSQQPTLHENGQRTSIAIAFGVATSENRLNLSDIGGKKDEDPGRRCFDLY
jgi:hypothetical protein